MVMATPSGDERSASLMLERLLLQAISSGASDVHLEPQTEKLRVRFRVDGVLTERPGLPLPLAPPMTSRLKVLASLDIAEKRRPQDGGFRFAKGQHEINLRVSTFPTPHGEKVVLRLLSQTSVILGLERLGLGASLLESFRRVSATSHGIVLVTGPTGSGKTTTLYSLLKELRSAEVNIVTLEDPIEYRMEGITQGQTRPQIGFSFAEGLRAILRQDPDIILVGEMRDQETAEVAFRAALTGHLVLSTLHTNSALETVVRLLDMGLERFVLASALRGILAQRLIRLLCRHCRRPQELSSTQREELGLPPDAVVYEAQGCMHCHKTGYQGRGGIFELLEVDEPLAERIKDSESARGDLQKLLIEREMTTLYQAGMERVARGETSVEEILRVL